MTKTIRFILVSLMIWAGSAAVVAQDNARPKKIIIIEDYFFNSLPVASSEITGMTMISTPNGTKATGITLAHPLPEAAIKYAVPDDSVPEAAELKERFAEAKVIPLQMSSEEKVKAGTKFPEFTAVDIDGKEWSNADVAGKPMVLNLWFTGCGPCRAEMPEFSQWKNEMPDVMFFAATYEDADRARPVIEKQGFNWIALINDTQFKEWVGGKGYPMTIVVDKTGIITHVEYGSSPVQREELKKQIEAVR
ncbi:MAG: TlpA family protein disulfide reductase [Odoribacter sp.]|nr:TlpA family protein disulfide reductase [Odoribacter sp.]